ncbi:dynamin-related protein 4C-like [Dendrobium catenatum]|uniref:Dynamin-related protein 4C n=1 Tax=Dendrobium catenatum TaxID=906689 RepID=A0A2I0VTC7_9ASPA|nr:dynamin-related protein 4C-like [Dendrobium catenatum]PKU66656.1 Dynamin-related protein 4C [Dendrobium catenatum]
MAPPCCEDSKQIQTLNALTCSYNDQIRPLLDAVDRLRQLKVMQEGIELPTIVVVGDQSSGKSSVLESLAGISLPRGQGICTRVPLIMRLQDDPSLSSPILHLEYKGKQVPTSESSITAAIESATAEIAGSGKGISDTPLTLVVRKKGVPDLTMVDLPGITRVPVHGQPENIYEQIAAIIMQYIKPAESIILNVLSASVDFPTCESIRMSQQVDGKGERTLAVVTKADKSPEGLLEKVTADDVNIGLGYVCVRNRIGSETYEEARAAEANLFKSHHLLSKIDKSIVGIPVLANKLMRIQSQSIAKCLPDIVKKINEKLNRNVSELETMPQNLVTVGDAMRAFMQIISKTKEMLRKLLIRGEFDDFPDDKEMHDTARMAEMLNAYAAALPDNIPTKEAAFLLEEIEVLEENRGIWLPNFLPRTAFLILLQKRVKEVSSIPQDFVEKVWIYLEDLVVAVLDEASENYPPLQACSRRAALNLIEKMRGRSIRNVKEIIEMEMVTDFTYSPDYMKKWVELMEQQERFMEVVHNNFTPTKVILKAVGEVDVSHLRGRRDVVVEQAFDIRMRQISYWKSVVLRLVDVLALNIAYDVKKLVENELETEIMNDVVGGRSMNCIEKMLEESPAISGKRERLRKSIQLLRESKEVVAKIIDRIAVKAAD